MSRIGMRYFDGFLAVYLGILSDGCISRGTFDRTGFGETETDDQDGGKDPQQAGRQRHPVRPPPVDEQAAEARPQELPQPQEHRVQAHDRSPVGSVVFGDVRQVSKGGRGKAALDHDADHQQQGQGQHPGGVQRGLMIDQEDHHAGDEQSDGADEHCGSLFYIGEERDPDQDAENKKERIGGANVPCLQAVVGADQDLTRETALVGEDARRQVDPDAQDGIDRDPCRYKPGNPGSAQDRPVAFYGFTQ